VLLVVRAQPAVQRTAVAQLGLELQRERARLVEAKLRHVKLGVGVHERLEAPVLRAALAQDHTVLADVHLRVDDALTDGADRPGRFEEHLVSVALCSHVGARHQTSTW
jgi:hypothetical protein